MSDRTEIDGIERYIYYKHTSDFKKTLTFKIKLKGPKYNKFSIYRVNASSPGNMLIDYLFFDNVSEIKSLFSKIDSLGIDESLKERKKTTHYEISKYKRSIGITQYSSSADIGNDFVLTSKEYDGIKSSFEKYLLEN